MRRNCPCASVVECPHLSHAATRPHAYQLIEKAAACPHGIILTSYEQLRKHADDLLDINWGYVVLDEGHKIRNPDADITLLCKQVRRRAC